jgi:hypothetical protein
MGTILVSFLLNHVEISCAIATTAGWILSIVLVGVAIVHQTAKGALTAGTIITIRTVVVNFNTLLFCVILFMGRTENCEA